ncbi:MAG TPA: zinc dependent phospholipase C family protein [Acidobacteriaceae bacterium]|nr:zinc dependent phospholipase C family protein [Acidobacteriaceae bacterium]
MAALRTFVLPPILVLTLLLASSRPAGAYSVLTHEELVDLTWADSIQPLLLKRFPNLTPLQLQEAHAYAYGGCVIQDLGYYPFGKPIFSALLHYVRTGDFIRALFRDSKDANDIAFAIGALSHYFGDTIGHPAAINIAVGKEFPKLAARYGPDVNYAEGPHQHVRAEFAFDVNDIGKHRLAPERYLDRIGFAVPVPLLTRAFYDTYGLDLANVLGHDHPKLRGYRFSVRSLLPRVAYAEDMLHRKNMPPDVSSPDLDAFNREIAILSAANHWSNYHHRGPRIGTHLLAAVIFIVPKVGVLSDLAIRPPSASAEQDYVTSLMHTVSVMRSTLAAASKSDGLPNLDLDTGKEVAPGTYSLEDYTYVDLLHRMTRDPSQPVPFGIKQDLLAYFADLDKVKYIRRDTDRLAQVHADLPILQKISTRAAYPDTAFLPQPDAAKPPEAKGKPTSNAPEPPNSPANSKPPQQ